jgi:hypothetical protein
MMKKTFWFRLIVLALTVAVKGPVLHADTEVAHLSDLVSLRSVGASLAIHGGYADLRGFPLNDQLALGARLAAIFNHVFSFGVGADGIISTNYRIALMGLFVDVDPWSNRLFHPSLGATFGGAYLFRGGVASGERSEDGRFFAQPEARLHLNLARNLRVSTLFSYRFLAGADRIELPNSAVNGFQVSLQFTGGLF